MSRFHPCVQGVDLGDPGSAAIVTALYQLWMRSVVAGAARHIPEAPLAGAET